MQQAARYVAATSLPRPRTRVSTEGPGSLSSHPHRGVPHTTPCSSHHRASVLLPCVFFSEGKCCALCRNETHHVGYLSAPWSRGGSGCFISAHGSLTAGHTAIQWQPWALRQLQAAVPCHWESRQNRLLEYVERSLETAVKHRWAVAFLELKASSSRCGLYLKTYPRCSRSESVPCFRQRLF